MACCARIGELQGSTAWSINTELIIVHRPNTEGEATVPTLVRMPARSFPCGTGQPDLIRVLPMAGTWEFARRSDPWAGAPDRWRPRNGLSGRFVCTRGANVPATETDLCRG